MKQTISQKDELSIDVISLLKHPPHWLIRYGGFILLATFLTFVIVISSIKITDDNMVKIERFQSSTTHSQYKISFKEPILIALKINQSLRIDISGNCELNGVIKQRITDRCYIVSFEGLSLRDTETVGEWKACKLKSEKLWKKFYHSLFVTIQ